MFKKSSEVPRKKKIKNIIALASGLALTAGAIVGVSLSSINIANNAIIDNDFSEGKNFQINLELVDANGNFIQNVSTEEELLKESASYLTRVLVDKGLTNIKVNYGFQYREEISGSFRITPRAVDPNPFIKNNKKVVRYGVLSATFNNNEATLGLKDINDSVNNFYNDNQIFRSLTNSNAYTLEVFPSTFNSVYHLPSNYRWDKSSLNNKQEHLYYIDSTSANDLDLLKVKRSLINDSSNYNNKIKPYVDVDGNESLSKVQIDAKNTYNNGVFVNDLNQINEIKANENENNSSSTSFSYPLSLFNQRDGTQTPPNEEGQTPPEEPSKPSKVDQFQTTATWILWKDKQGLINYLNSLIIGWYFNLYANIYFNFDNVDNVAHPSIDPNEVQKINKDNMDEKLFNTAKYAYANYVDPGIRDQINVYINSLSSIEKQFMAYCAIDNPGVYGQFYPSLITEDNLIPILYGFYNSKSFAAYEKPDINTSSKSELNGWGWIESDAGSTPVSELVGNYLVSFIDYRNFQDYFVNPNPPDTSAENYKETDPIDPYYINDLLLTNSSFTAKAFAKILTDDFFRFPVKIQNQETFINDFQLFINEFSKLGTQYQDYRNNGKLDVYYKEVNVLANKYIQPSVAWSYQNLSRPYILETFNNFSSLNMLFIIISCFIFLIGIFISVRYRIPGFIAFILTSLTYVLSLLIYSLFGFSFSFFSLIVSTINAVISYLISFLFCKNSYKEILKSQNVLGTIIASIKKYWKICLDIDVVLILSSLAFLFFGKINNRSIGAILIISVFLSFILNGILYFILILFYVSVLDVTNICLYVANKSLLKTNKFKDKFISLGFVKTLRSTFVSVNYFSKWSYISLAIVILVCCGGVIILFLMNPISSVDFTSSNIIYINNFDSIGLNTNQIIKMLNVNVFNSYVYNNQFVIYTTNHLNYQDVAYRVNNAMLLDNMLITYLSSDINIELVKNTFICLAIGIGFSCVWYLISLNIVSVLPLVLTQGLICLLLLGLTGMTRIPFDINSIVILIISFIIASALMILIVSQLRTKLKKKTTININEFKNQIKLISSQINLYQISVYLFLILFAICSLILVSSSLIYIFVLMIIVNLGLILVNNLFTIICWYWSNIVFNKFTKQIVMVEQFSPKFDYDKVNEQPIKNLNC